MVQARAFAGMATADRRAAMDLAAVGMNMLLTLDNESIAREDARQIANASAALEAERAGVDQHFADHPDEASQWGQWFHKEQEGIRSRVLSGVTTPGAKEAISNKLTVTLAGWSGAVAQKRATQIRRNANTDFNTRTKTRLDNAQTYADINDLDEALVTALADVDGAEADGLDSAATPAQADELRRQLGVRMIGDFLLQDMVAAGDARPALEVANTMAADYGLPENTFGPDDLDRLKRYAEARIGAAQADAKAQHEAMLQAYSKNLSTNFIATGKYNEGINSVIAQEGLTLDEQSGFINDISSIASKVQKDKEYSQAEKNAAEAQARRLLAARDFENFDKYMIDHADKLTGVSSSLYNDRYSVTNTPSDPIVTESLKSLDAVKKAKVHGDRAKDVEYVARVEKQHDDLELELQSAITALGPDATPKQKNEVADAIIDKAAQSAAKELGTFAGTSLWITRWFGPRPARRLLKSSKKKAENKPTYKKGDRRENAQGDAYIYDGKLWQPQ